MRRFCVALAAAFAGVFLVPAAATTTPAVVNGSVVVPSNGTITLKGLASVCLGTDANGKIVAVVSCSNLQIAGSNPVTVTIANGVATVSLSGIVPIANGGTGTATPGATGSGPITVSGTWPNQSIACLVCMHDVNGSLFTEAVVANVPADGTTTSVTFPTAFATSVSQVIVTPSGYSGSDNAAVFALTSNITTSGFSVTVGGGAFGSTVSLHYIAIGK